MVLTLHSPFIHPEIVSHSTLDLMTKLTDYHSTDGTTLTAKEQDEALRSAWISNTEVKLIKRKSSQIKSEVAS